MLRSKRARRVLRGRFVGWPSAAQRAMAISSILIATSIGGSAPGRAHDHLAPKTFLVTSTEQRLQEGLLASNCWMQRRRDRYVQHCADASWQFPPPTAVASGIFELRLLTLKDQRPRDVLLKAWRAIDKDQQPIGDGEEIEVEVRRKRLDNGSVAYLLRGTTYVVGDLYLWAFARWRDEEGSDFVQDAAWTYHVRSH